MSEDHALLLSGGFDSLTLAADLIKNPHRYGVTGVPSLIHFTANDPIHQHCTSLVRSRQIPWLSELAGCDVPHHIIDVSPVMQSIDPKSPRDLYVTLDDTAPENSHDVGRQVLFVSLAFNRMSMEGRHRLFAAFQMQPGRWANFDDYDDLGDDTPTFVEAINELGRVGGFTPEHWMIAPFLDARLSKADIINIARDLGVPGDASYSCVFSAPEPCNACNACYIYNKGCADAGYDPRKALP